MLKCKSCGADVHFDPKTQSYICEYCGKVMTQDELSEAERAGEINAEEQETYAENPNAGAGNGADSGDNISDDYIKVITYTCPQCGGVLFTTEDTVATFCSYCGSSVLLEKKVSKELKPEYIIPFQVTQEEAAANYRAKLKKAIFAPSYMKNMDVEKVRGIYMPYWTYSIKGYSTVRAEKTITTPVIGGQKIDEYVVTADVQYNGDGIEYDSATSFPDDLSMAIAPYAFRSAEKFQASYMSGFYADAGDVSADVYAPYATDVMKTIVADKASSYLDVPSAPIFNKLADPDVKGSRAMYPVWFIAARNKASNKVSYGVVNGQSGKTVADIPVDKKKLLIGMLLFAIPIFAILYFLITPNPKVTNWAVMFLSVIGGFFAVRNMLGKSRVQSAGGVLKRSKTPILVGTVFAIILISLIAMQQYDFALYIGIIGIVFVVFSNKVLGKKISLERKNGAVQEGLDKIYILPLIMNILSVAVCIIVIVWNPVRDLYFYAADIAAGIFSVISYWTLFEIHNKSTLRKLPQLGKRGGDE